MKKFYPLFIAITLTLFALPAILMFAGYKNENKENRLLAAKPELIKDASLNMNFSKDFDSYIDDNFAFREHIITAYNNASTFLLNDYSGNRVVVGRDGMLFFSDTLNDYLGVEQLSHDEINSIANYLFDLQQQLSAEGIAMLFITAPNKATIYPEYMPSYLFRTAENTNIDMLNTAMQECGVGHIDAKSILNSAKNNGMVYYRHDSHWNNLGAILMHNAIAQYLGIDQYDIDAHTSVYDRMGDLHCFMYPATVCNEERLLYNTGEYRSSRPINMNRDNRIETTSDANDITAYVWHDSFGESLQPFLSPSFGRLVMIRKSPSYYSIEEVVEGDADILIIELVERNLDELYAQAQRNGF